MEYVMYGKLLYWQIICLEPFLLIMEYVMYGKLLYWQIICLEPFLLIMEYVMYGKLLTHLREQRAKQSSFFTFSKVNIKGLCAKFRSPNISLALPITYSHIYKPTYHLITYLPGRIPLTYSPIISKNLLNKRVFFS